MLRSWSRRHPTLSAALGQRPAAVRRPDEPSRRSCCLAAGASGKVLVRGDSAYGHRAVVPACRRGKAQFSLVVAKNRAIQRAIDSIAADQWTPGRYPNAVLDPDTRA